MKRVSKILVMALCVCALSKANAQTWNIGDPVATDVTATLNTTDSTLVISGMGAMINYSSRSSVPWYSSYHNFITSVVINSGVTSIGNHAFFNCSCLTSVTIPNSVTTIGDYVFSLCSSLTAINVEATNPRYSALDGVVFSKLQDTLICYPAGKTGSYVIPNSATTVENSAFATCRSLTSVTIPNSVTTIGYWAFEYCSSLTAIDVEASNPNYSSLDGMLFNKSQDTLIRCPEGKMGSYTIPNSATTIGNNAFFNCTGLTSVTIPNSVTMIGDYAFYDCTGLTSIIIPNSVTTIGDGAFHNCRSLTSVTIGNSITTIGDDAFGYCDVLDTIRIKAASPPSLGTNVFGNTPATEIHVLCGTSYPNPWQDKITAADILPKVMLVYDTAQGIAFVQLTATCDVTFAATPATTYRFLQWNDGDTTNPRTITVTQDTTFVAEFEQYIFDVTLHVNNPVMGTVSGGGSYEKDSTATITATANPGYRFADWSDGETSSVRTITVISDTTLTANFEVENDIAETQFVGSAHVYPNPTRGNITVALPDHATHAVFVVYDLQGRELLRRSISGKDVVSVGGISAGMYVYNLVVDGKHQQGKLSIVR